MTHGVVTPNIVRPRVGRSTSTGNEFLTMPAIACAALPRMRRETEFNPATSTTEYMSVMSEQPT